MSGIEDTSDDVTITQRFASSLAALGITSTPRYDGLAVMVEGVKVCARIDDHTPEGTMWRLELWVDVGEDDAAAAAASAEVVQSVVAMYGRRATKGASDLLSLLDRHGETLSNAEPENPKWEEVQHDGVIRGWDIWVADGQVCAFVPYLPHSTGEVSDGGPLTDWRDAICAAGCLMLQARERIVGAEKRVAELEAENAKLRSTNLDLSGSIEDIDAEAAEAADHWSDEVKRLQARCDQMAAILLSEADAAEARAHRIPGEPSRGDALRYASYLRAAADGGVSNG